MNFLTIEDITPELIDNIFSYKRTSLEKIEGTVVGLFLQPSTRTRLSFELAAQQLGLNTCFVSDVQSLSVQKGETFSDTLYNVQELLSSVKGKKVIVCRSPVSYWWNTFVAKDDFTLINAGDGTNEHPTQALIDLFTLAEKVGFENLNKQKVIICGDVRDSRVAHSSALLLKNYCENVTLCSYSSVPEILKHMPQIKFKFFPECLGDFDVIMILRDQAEYKSSKEEIPAEFCLDGKTYNTYCPHSFVMHPGPTSKEITTVVKNSKNSLILNQAKNGVVVRKKLLQNLLAAQGF